MTVLRSDSGHKPAGGTDLSFTREMGLDPASLLRAFAPVAAGWDCMVTDRDIHLRKNHKHLHIMLQPAPDRRLGALTLPTTIVKFHFQGFTHQETSEFMQRMDRHLQRGGG